MADRLRVLLIEDAELDAGLILRELKRADLRCEANRVQTESELRQALAEFAPDVILSDFSMPHFDGMSALAVVRELTSDTPFIFVSGTLGEEYAIRALREGATDYVLKSNLVRLPPTVERAVREAKERAAKREAERQLQALRERIENIIVTLPDVVWSAATPSGEWLYVSQPVTAIFGHSAQSLMRDGLWSSALVHPDDLGRVTTEWRRALVGGPFDCEFRVLHGQGGVRWAQAHGRHATDATGKVVRIDGVLRDVTERHEQQLRIANLNRIHTVLGQVNALIVRASSRDELFREACRIAVEAGGMRSAWLGIVDSSARRVQPVASHGLEPDFLGQITDHLRRSEQDGGSAGVLPVAAVDGTPVFVNDLQSDTPGASREIHLRWGVHSMAALPLVIAGRVAGLMVLHASERGFFNDQEVKLLLDLAGDIAFALDRMEKADKLDYLAYYDPLTGLANRSLFHERLDQDLRAADRDRGRLAVLILDVDRFKAVNESLGRHAGDALLRQIGERFTQEFRQARLLARIGADRFGLVIPELKGEGELARRIDSSLRECFGEPFRLRNEELRVSARVGAAVFPADGVDAESLFHNAEAALNQAKRSGERYMFYQREMNARVAERLTLENRLRRAIEAQEFVLHYQPKIDLGTRKIVGAEALLRWNNPETGLVPPGKFIPLLEETGMILEVGAWAMRRAVQDRRELFTRAAHVPVFAVNVSSIQLGRPDFVDTVRRALAEGGSGAQMELEITESMIMQDLQGTIAKLEEVRDFGVSIAIDDFGTGYSSLGYLAKLPVHTIKIDRSFVVSMLRDSDVMTVVSAMISLAHSLRLRVVAEGVDSEEQVKILQRLQCDELQGYLFSPAVAMARFEEMLRGNPQRPVRRQPANL